jgi:hypothetical protein
MPGDKINKDKIMSTINAVQSGRIGTGTGLKIIGAELKEGIFPAKSGRTGTKTENKAKGGLMKKKTTKKKITKRKKK